ncbi:unnamed protein product [Effrenium voratum]|uniref:Nudix hydrolase domain-containing protein n=1 Tax=Effrenium voratum TaxID=2562239 RepID=A0AA36HWF1_9DINO|nr:unnamed protein product [Effrenium voratum]
MGSAVSRPKSAPAMATRQVVLLVGSAARLVEAVEASGGQAQVADSGEAPELLRRLGPSVACVVCENPGLLPELRKGEYKQIFTIAMDEALADDPLRRLGAFAQGARMVSAGPSFVEKAVAQALEVARQVGPFACPGCGLCLSEDALHLHMHFHHAVENLPKAPCPICGEQEGSVAVHVHNRHGPSDAREPPSAPYATFAWCVCRHPDGRFLLVNEPAGISGGRPGFWLPAGRVDHGESLQEACVREALEEAGVAVRVTGVLRMMVDSQQTLRVVFLAEPEDPAAQPKSIPDWESVGAMWVTVEELQKLKAEHYRHPDPAELFPPVAAGKLQPHPVDTAAFVELEALIRRLTKGERKARDEQVVRQM